MSKTDMLKPLPFSFAKRNGVLVHQEDPASQSPNLIFRESLDLVVLAEVQRFCRSAVVPTRVNKAVFDQLLSES